MNPQDRLDPNQNPSNAPIPQSAPPVGQPLQQIPQNQNIGTVPRETVKISDAIKEPEEAGEKTHTIRTFQSDLAGAVKQDNVSMIKIAMAEKARQEQEGDYAPVDFKRKVKKAYIVASGVLLVVFGSLGFVFYYFNRPAAPTLEQIIAPNEPEIIYSESQVAVSLDGKTTATFLQELQDETLARIDLGTIKRILITTGAGTSTRNISSQEFFEQIRARAPDSLKRSLSPYFVVGAYSFTPHDVFIIFKVDSYDNAYAGMLAWEPYMKFDIGKMFPDIGAVPNNQNQVSPEIVTMAPADSNTETPIDTEVTASSTDGDTASSTESTDSATSTEEQAPATPARSTSDDIVLFADKVMQNKDTRVLYNSDGTIKLLYSFLDKKTLVIVSSEKGLKEIIARTTTGRIVR